MLNRSAAKGINDLRDRPLDSHRLASFVGAQMGAEFWGAVEGYDNRRAGFVVGGDDVADLEIGEVGGAEFGFGQLGDEFDGGAAVGVQEVGRFEAIAKNGVAWAAGEKLLVNRLERRCWDA